MNSKHIIYFVLLFLFACQKEKNNSNTKVIGHAATGLKMPSSFYHDNSIEAIHKALETEGCDGIEIDVQLSATGTLWLFHDSELSVETNASGCLNSKSDAELEAIRYQTLHKEKLARFQDIPFHKLMGKTLMLDLRHYNACQETIVTADLVLNRLLQYPELQTGNIQVYLLTNYQPWLLEMASAPFEIIYSTETLSEANLILGYSSVHGLMIKNAKITKEEVAQLKDSGKKIIIFEVRSPKNIRKALRKRPDYLVTDDIRATIIEK